ncbi:MAG: hypothetical protein OEU54_16475 [Gemmatimonadota bacterium]|nr:hypothetical protein [Gemmatimonadota bacterium]
MRRHTRTFLSAFAAALVLTLGASGVNAQHVDTPMFDGAWEVTLNSQMGEMTMAFELESDGQAISGVAVSPAGEAVVEGAQDGHDLAFTMFIDQPDHQVELEFTGIMDGDTAEGSVHIMGETFDWSAKRADAR